MYGTGGDGPLTASWTSGNPALARSRLPTASHDGVKGIQVFPVALRFAFPGGQVHPCPFHVVKIATQRRWCEDGLHSPLQQRQALFSCHCVRNTQRAGVARSWRAGRRVHFLDETSAKRLDIIENLLREFLRTPAIRLPVSSGSKAGNLTHSGCRAAGRSSTTLEPL